MFSRKPRQLTKQTNTQNVMGWETTRRVQLADFLRFPLAFNPSTQLFWGWGKQQWATKFWAEHIFSIVDLRYQSFGIHRNIASFTSLKLWHIKPRHWCYNSLWIWFITPLHSVEQHTPPQSHKTSLPPLSEESLWSKLMQGSKISTKQSAAWCQDLRRDSHSDQQSQKSSPGWTASHQEIGDRFGSPLNTPTVRAAPTVHIKPHYLCQTHRQQVKNHNSSQHVLSSKGGTYRFALRGMGKANIYLHVNM